MIREIHFLRIVLNHFSFGETLADAARLLVEHARNDVSGAEILSALQRSDVRSSFRVHLQNRNVSLHQQDDHFIALEGWLRIIDTLGDVEATKQLIEFVETIIREVDFRGYATSYFTDFYNEYRRITDAAGIERGLSVKELAENLVESCGDPQEFVALHALIKGCDGVESIRLQLKTRFPKEAQKWLDCEVQNTTLSTVQRCRILLFLKKVQYPSDSESRNASVA